MAQHTTLNVQDAHLKGSYINDSYTEKKNTKIQRSLLNNGIELRLIIYLDNE